MWVMVGPLGKGQGESHSGGSTAVYETDLSLPLSRLGRVGMRNDIRRSATWATVSALAGRSSKYES